MIYEFKTYMATEGNFAALKKRFAEKTIPIFSRLGIEVTHCWDNLENADTFNYLVRFSSKEAEKAAWDAFAKDEEWKMENGRWRIEYRHQTSILNSPSSIFRLYSCKTEDNQRKCPSSKYFLLDWVFPWIVSRFR